MATVGFIGTGNIGNPMARHILEAGHEVIIHDRNPRATENLLERGASPAGSPREVAERARTVFLSLPGPSDVEAVVQGADGILAGASLGDIIVDLSTGSVTAVRRIAQVAAAAGVLYLDSPVTGGVAGADAGTLTVLASGDALAFEKTEPFLRTFGSTVFYLGESGMGTTAKLVNNVIALCAGQLVQEGLVLARKAGLDPGKLAEILNVGSSKPYVGSLPQLIERRLDNPSFALALAAKDVGLALETARDLAVPMPVAAAAHQTYLRALAAGYGGETPAATLKTLEAGANLGI